MFFLYNKFQLTAGTKWIDLDSNSRNSRVLGHTLKAKIKVAGAAREHFISFPVTTVAIDVVHVGAVRI